MNADPTPMNADENPQMRFGMLQAWTRNSLVPLSAFIGVGSAYIGAFKALILQSIDRGKVAPESIRVHAEAEDVAVGDGDAHEVGGDGLRAADVLVGEDRAEHFARAHLQQLLADRRDRDALIQDLLDHD